MKVKNDLVRIQLGNRKFDFHNLIMNEYINRLASRQLDPSNLINRGYNLLCDNFYIKFDTALTFDATSKIDSSSFDINLPPATAITQNLSIDAITINYTQALYKQNLINYIGKKITAIGFKNAWETDKNGNQMYMFAILDTSKYNIYIQTDEDLTITRKDIISTDAIFYSSNLSKVPAPAHLAPYGLPNILEQPEVILDGYHYYYKNQCYGILSTINYGYDPYITIQSHSPDFAFHDTSNLILSFNEDLIKQDTSYYPQLDYPQLDYPSNPRIKYIILKYKVFQVVYSVEEGKIVQTPTDTGEWYYESFPISIYGNSIQIKYERG